MLNGSSADVPVPPPIAGFGSSETRIANASATTHVAIANAPARNQSTTAATGMATAPPMNVASSIDRYGLSECWTERKTAAYAPMPMNPCWPTDTSPP